jgi:hypothetical protein
MAERLRHSAGYSVGVRRLAKVKHKDFVLARGKQVLFCDFFPPSKSPASGRHYSPKLWWWTWSLRWFPNKISNFAARFLKSDFL